MNFFSFDMNSIVSVPAYRVMIGLTDQLFVFIIYLFIRYFKIQISLFENMSKKSKKILIINSIFAILALSIQFFITGFYLNKLPLYIVVFSKYCSWVLCLIVCLLFLLNNENIQDMELHLSLKICLLLCILLLLSDCCFVIQK